MTHTDRPKLQIVVASTRPGRVGGTIADWLGEQVPDELGFDVEIVDLAAVGLPMLDEPHHPSERMYLHEHTRAWSASVGRADAFVFVMPEYNTGFTAPLKNALDYLYEEWRHKPVGFVSYGMTSGGLRAVEMLKPVLVALNMVPVHAAVSIPLRAALDEQGSLRPTEAMLANVGPMLSELHTLARTLRPLRMTAGSAPG